MPKIDIPVDVPDSMLPQYIDNYNRMTHGTGRLMLFAGDQRIEHLNYDFFGDDIARDDNNPEHLFRIADRANIGVFATHLGLISRYARQYDNLPYLIKLNSKTNLIKTAQKDPLSSALTIVEEVVRLKKECSLNILGIGLTVYIGSEFESEMLSFAAHSIHTAHRNGLVAILWVYPRGKSVLNEGDAHLIAGAACVGVSLGADFIKVNYPSGGNQAIDLQEAVEAAGNTKLICAGGSDIDPRKFLQRLYDQIHISGASGSATGRNIHQKPLNEAIRFSNAIAAITFDNESVEDAMKIYNV